MSSHLHAGLVSVTFRKLSVREIVDLCVQSQLEGVEWGGDVHARPGDIQRAKEIHQMTVDHGLQVAAYGSYYRLGTHEIPFEKVLETAIALHAPTIRVWAGTIGSHGADELYWESVISDGRRIAEMASSTDVSISFEFHPDTLADTSASALRLIKAIDRPNIRSYWQPGIDQTHENKIASLTDLLPWLSNVHVFHWQPGYERQPLRSGREDWSSYLEIIRRTQLHRFLMLEFVQFDSVDAFLHDAQVLKQWLENQGTTSTSGYNCG